LKILVTGASSFVGRALIPKLSSQDHEVSVITRNPRRNLLHESIAPTTRIIEGDLTTLYRPKEFSEGIDILIHLAAYSPDFASKVDLSSLCEFNIFGARTIAEFARSMNVALVINASTISVHGQNPGESISHKTPVNPEDPYAVSKLQAERILASQISGAPVLSIRLPCVVGKGAHRHWLARFVNSLKYHKEGRLYGPENLINSAVCVNDLAQFMSKLCTSDIGKFSTDSFPVASREPISVKAIESLVRSLGNPKLSVVYAKTSRTSSLIDDAHARSLFEYESQSMKQCLANYFREELVIGL
jgi:nucleoside-diphosphate-sugar epimerase